MAGVKMVKRNSGNMSFYGNVIEISMLSEYAKTHKLRDFINEKLGMDYDEMKQSQRDYIRRRLCRKGIHFVYNSLIENKMGARFTEELTEAIKNKMRIIDICEKFNISRAGISAFKKRHQLGLRVTRKGAFYPEEIIRILHNDFRYDFEKIKQAIKIESDNDRKLRNEMILKLRNDKKMSLVNISRFFIISKQRIDQLCKGPSKTRHIQFDETKRCRICKSVFLIDIPHSDPMYCDKCKIKLSENLAALDKAISESKM